MDTLPHLLKKLISLGIGYLRWLAFTPMVIIWGVIILMLLAMAVVSNEESTLSLFESTALLISKLPIVGPKFTVWIQDPIASDRPLSEQLLDLMMGVWWVLSLILMLFEMALNALFGPFKALTLRKKLKLTAALCLLIPVTFGVMEWAAPERIAGWVSGFPIALVSFVISAICLFLGDILTRFENSVEIVESKKSNPNQ